MDTPGKLLKIRREEQGKSLEDFSRILKIRYDYLKAIEDENYQFIPDEVFTKGYMRIYANVLGLNSDNVLELYKKQIASNQPIEQPTTKEKTLLNYKPIMITASVVLIAILSILFIRYKYQEFNNVDIVKKVKEPLPVPKLWTEEPKGRLASKMFSLEIIATEETWISVSVDKGSYEQRLLGTGEVVRWTASEGFSIKIGNAGGTKLIFNGKDIGNLGPHGKVVRVTLPNEM